MLSSGIIASKPYEYPDGIPKSAKPLLSPRIYEFAFQQNSTIDINSYIQGGVVFKQSNFGVIGGQVRTIETLDKLFEAMPNNIYANFNWTHDDNYDNKQSSGQILITSAGGGVVRKSVEINKQNLTNESLVLNTDGLNGDLSTYKIAIGMLNFGPTCSIRFSGYD